MSLNSKRTRPLVGLLAGLGVIAAGGIAEAATVQLSTGVLLLKQSSNATVKRGTGAGILMPRVEQIAGNKLMAIWMDSAPDSIVPKSDADDNNGYWEGKVSIIQLNAQAAPTIVSTQQVTHFTGDRPFNHPRLAAGGAGDYVIVNFASSLEDPNITNQYVMALDSTGAVLKLTGKSLNGDNDVTDSNGVHQEVLNVGQNDGDNHGAAEMHFLATDSAGVDHFLGGYLHNNNDTYISGLSVTKTATGINVVQDWKVKAVSPANIGRPTCAVTGATTATCCAAKGNNRPPEVGIQCVALDTTKGTILNKAIVVASNPEQKVYMNQPTITFLGNGTCGLGVVMSDGQGRNRNGHFLGTNVSMAHTIDCTALTIKNTRDRRRALPAPRHDGELDVRQPGAAVHDLDGLLEHGRRRRGHPAHRRGLERHDDGGQAEQPAPRHVAVRHRVALVQGSAQPERPGPRLPPHAGRRREPRLRSPERLDAGGL